MDIHDARNELLSQPCHVFVQSARDVCCSRKVRVARSRYMIFLTTCAKKQAHALLVNGSSRTWLLSVIGLFAPHDRTRYTDVDHTHEMLW